MSYILGFVYNYRRFLLGGVGAVLAIGLGWGALVVWHFEPIDSLVVQVRKLELEVNSTHALLVACESRRRVESFESLGRGRADSIREYIDRRLDSERVDSNSSSVDSWVF